MEQIPALDYPAIAKRLAAASIIGVGESTHGTHEFFQTKTELFKELVQNHGFNTFSWKQLMTVAPALTPTYKMAKVSRKTWLVNYFMYIGQLKYWI